jgi:hypothetical protein
MSSANTKMVLLKGGSYDGQTAEAPLSPEGLRLYGRDSATRWSELYVYAEGLTAETSEHGRVPVMFMERDDAPEE